MNSTPQNTGGGISFNKTSGRKKIWVVVLATVFCLGVLLVWMLYLSPEAKDFHKEKENIQKAEETLAKYDEMMRNDTYGGKTPEETLNLFVEALKNNDVELASRYFIEDSNLKRDDIIENLTSIQKEKGFADFIEILNKTESYNKDISHEGDYKFVVYDNDMNVVYYIDMEFNRYSGVWKIQSL